MKRAEDALERNNQNVKIRGILLPRSPQAIASLVCQFDQFAVGLDQRSEVDARVDDRLELHIDGLSSCLRAVQGLIL